MSIVDRIDPSFGNWLAGFADGEGCFIIQRVGSTTKTYICNFVIAVRLDDREILDEVQRRLGLGKVTVRQQKGGMAAPQAWWGVIRKAECAQLVELFDAFPLRAKKARDFAIWREAVAEWHRFNNRGPLKGRAARDWSPMERLQQELRDGRKYAPPE